MNIFTIIPSLGPIWQPALDSIKRQVGYKSTAITLIIQDDCGSEQLTPLGCDPNTLVWKRKGRHYSAKNIYDGFDKLMMFSPAQKDICCIVDGDDYLNGKSAFEVIERNYRNQNVWLTYGSYTRLNDGRKVGRPYVTRDYRTERWRGSHFKTFRFWLAQKIPEGCYKGMDGDWLRVCYDLAMMFPMIEMAGWDRIRFIPNSLYIYNNLSSINDYKVRGEEQVKTDEWIRGLPKFEQLEKL